MKLNNRFIFGLLSILLATVIAFVALPTIAKQTNGKTEIVRITKPVLKGEQLSADNTETVEVGSYNPVSYTHLRHFSVFIKCRRPFLDHHFLTTVHEFSRKQNAKSCCIQSCYFRSVLLIIICF